MKKTLLLAAALVTATSMMADWGPYDEPTRIFPIDTNDYGFSASPGTNVLWTVIYDSTVDEAASTEEITKAKYQFRLQGVRPDGTLVFPEGGKLISEYANLSFSMYNNRVFTDRDGNAIVMVQDLRNSDTTVRAYTLTLYKVSPDGEMLWGEDGICPTTNTRIQYLTASQACQLQDGTYVVCWQGMSTGVSYMQRISEDGKTFYWGERGISADGVYPILIPAEDNQVTLVYIAGGIRAMKFDMDGEKAWSSPARVFPYSFNSMTPDYLMFDAIPLPDGKTLVFWRDDRDNKGYYSPYISIVTSDGKLLFSGASDDGDVKLTTSQMFSCMGITAAPDPDGDGVVAMWISNFANMNNYGGLTAQRVNMDGELEWGDEGLPFEEATTETSYELGSIQPDNEGNLAFFYTWSAKDGGLAGWNNMNNLVRLVDPKTGDPLWKEDISLLASPAHVSSLDAFNFPEQKCWITTWTRGTYSQGNEVRVAQRINYDGQLITDGPGEDPAISVGKIKTDGELTVTVCGDNLRIYSPEETEATIHIYDITGAEASVPVHTTLQKGENKSCILTQSIGTYLISIYTHIGNKTIKLVKQQ